MEYSKIQTLFKRDANNIIIPTEFTYPEFEFMKDCKFRCEAKIDGTNTRIELYPNSNITKAFMVFKGRTDKAQMPSQLLEELNRLFDEKTLIEYFSKNSDFNAPITIYGEGYGKKIQSCGGKYCKDHAKFIVFDIKIGDWWLNRPDIEQICKDLNLDIVPIMGYFTVQEAIEYVKKGFKDPIAEEDLDADSVDFEDSDMASDFGDEEVPEFNPDEESSEEDLGDLGDIDLGDEVRMEK